MGGGSMSSWREFQDVAPVLSLTFPTKYFPIIKCGRSRTLWMSIVIVSLFQRKIQDALKTANTPTDAAQLFDFNKRIKMGIIKK